MKRVKTVLKKEIKSNSTILLDSIPQSGSITVEIYQSPNSLLKRIYNNFAVIAGLPGVRLMPKTLNQYTWDYLVVKYTEAEKQILTKKKDKQNKNNSINDANRNLVHEYLPYNKYNICQHKDKDEKIYIINLNKKPIELPVVVANPTVGEYRRVPCQFMENQKSIGILLSDIPDSIDFFALSYFVSKKEQTGEKHKIAYIKFLPTYKKELLEFVEAIKASELHQANGQIIFEFLNQHFERMNLEENIKQAVYNILQFTDEELKNIESGLKRMASSVLTLIASEKPCNKIYNDIQRQVLYALPLEDEDDCVYQTIWL